MLENESVRSCLKSSNIILMVKQFMIVLFVYEKILLFARGILIYSVTRIVFSLTLQSTAPAVNSTIPIWSSYHLITYHVVNVSIIQKLCKYKVQILIWTRSAVWSRKKNSVTRDTMFKEEGCW